MEDVKIFNDRDAFFIAEKLDAIKFSLPIPPHDEKEFNNQDAYIIWTKLSGGGTPIVQAYGQFFSTANQNVLAGADVALSGQQFNLGVGRIVNSLTANDAGIYQLTVVLTMKNSLG